MPTKKKTSPSKPKSFEAMVPTRSSLLEGPQVLNRPGDIGGILIAWMAAIQPIDNANVRTETDARTSFIARVTAIAQSSMTADADKNVITGGVDEDPAVMTLFDEAARTTRNIVAFLTKKVVENAQLPASEYGELVDEIDNTMTACPKVEENSAAIMTVTVDLGGDVDTSPKLETLAEALEVIVMKVDDSEVEDVSSGGVVSSGSKR